MAMYTHTYRVEVETPGAKPGIIFSSDDFEQADAAFRAAVAERQAGTIYLLNRARILKKAEPA
ncbi:MAG: hypothetical protein GC182_08800 [Rhodopseudomonas sp.]|nr:hypothetical protein [Rhodopseudomonas sp.]